MPSFTDLLRGDETLGFARALEPRPFSFPSDWGPHIEYRIEWWYVTGNLETENKRHFGYQLTFFRLALTPKPKQRESAWGTNQIYMAHFALTDVEAGQFYAFERFSLAPHSRWRVRTRNRLRCGWKTGQLVERMELSYRCNSAQHKRT